MQPTTCIHDTSYTFTCVCLTMFPTTCIHDVQSHSNTCTFISTILTMHSTMSSTTPGLYPCSHDVLHDMYPRHLYINNPNDAFHDVVHDTWFVPMRPPRHVPTTLDSNLYPCYPRYFPRHPSTTPAVHDVVHDTWFVPTRLQLVPM